MSTSKTPSENHTAQCIWTHIGSDGYSDTFTTDCGEKVRAERPMDVGISLAPKAEEFGPYCRYCGKKIKDAGVRNYG